MMDKHLHIVTYTKEHGQFILSCQMNHKVLEADRHYINVEGDAKNLEQDHLAFTGIVNNDPIFAAGMIRLEIVKTDGVFPIIFSFPQNIFI